jgi:adenylyltransferase/sulfurtransferase
MSRYSRQELFEAIGKKGQQKIRQATIAIVGVGALGSVSAELLCRAGVKKLILLDRDFVEESNLQRQLLFEEADVGKAKALAAKAHLQKINVGVEIEAFVVDVNFRNVDVLKEADIIIDGTDNLETRFLLNEFSLKTKKPWVYGGAVQDRGFVIGFTGRSPCLHCVLPKAQGVGTCDTVGVLNTTTTLIASLQVNECLKLILGTSVGDVMHVKLMDNKFDVLKVKKNSSCKVCQGQYDYLVGRKGQEIIRFCRTGSFQLMTTKRLDLKSLKQELGKSGTVEDLGFCLVFKNMKIFPDRVLIPAKTETEAKLLYNKNFG